MRFATRCCAVLAIAGLVSLGCSGPDYGDRQPLSGTVTMAGAPLAKGNIQFSAVPGGNGFASAVITDGKYDIPVAGGVVPGKYVVRVSAADTTGAASGEPPSADADLAAELVPAEFNVNTTLEYEVTADGKNVYDVTIP